MSNQSMTDIAYEIISQSNEPIVFKDLWTKIVERTSAPASKMSIFYTNLSLDSRFVSLPEMKFDLRSRVKFEDSFIDTSSLEIDDDESEDEELDSEYSENYEESKEEEDEY